MQIPAIHRAHTRLQAYSRKANAGETRRKEYLRHLEEKETWLRLHLAFSFLGERVADLPPTIIEELGRWCSDFTITAGNSLDLSQPNEAPIFAEAHMDQMPPEKLLETLKETRREFYKWWPEHASRRRRELTTLPDTKRRRHKKSFVYSTGAKFELSRNAPPFGVRSLSLAVSSLKPSSKFQ